VRNEGAHKWNKVFFGKLGSERDSGVFGAWIFRAVEAWESSGPLNILVALKGPLC
jgi:hypothetical protein